MTTAAVLAPLALGHRIRLSGSAPAGAERLLTPDALAFVARLDSAFAARRCELIAARLGDAHASPWPSITRGGDAGPSRPHQTGHDAAPRSATPVVCPRGWHLVDKSVLVDGRPVAAGVLDVGLYFFHCAAKQLARGSGPYVKLPDTDDPREVELWNDVFDLAQDLLDLPRGTIRATVLVDTVFAAVELEDAA